MKLYAHLLIAAFALSARAATIPEKSLPEELKPPTDLPNDQHELPQQNTIKDGENNLRVNSIEDIPVKVVVEDVPVLKSYDEGNEVSPDVLKKIREEVKDPGTPQRQEHETQNPEHHVDVTSLKQAIEDTQVILRQGVQGVSEGINNFVVNNEQITALQLSIQTLRKTFAERIQQLNANIVKIIQRKAIDEFQTVRTNIEKLEDNFNEEIKNLERGVETIAVLRAEGENSETPPQNNNPFLQAMTSIQNYLSAMQNAMSGQNADGSLPDAVQSDSEGTTRPPWLPNFPNFGQLFANPFGPGTTEKPTEASQESKPSEDKEPAKKPEDKPQANINPIRQILERIPIVQGAIQRLTNQQNNNKPNKSSEPEKKPVKKTEPEKVEEPLKVDVVKVEPEKQEPQKTEEEKGLLFAHGPGHLENSAAPRDTIDSSGVKEEAVKESIPEIVKEELVPVPEKTEQVLV